MGDSYSESLQTFDVIPLFGWGTDDDADGVVTIYLGAVPPGTTYLVERITVETSDGYGTIAAPNDLPFELRAEQVVGPAAFSPGTLREFTPAGGEASADEADPIRFYQQENISARVAGLTFVTVAWAAVYLQIRVLTTPLPAEAEQTAEAGGVLGVGAGETPAEEGWN